MHKKIIYLLLLFLTFCDSMPKDWEWGMQPRPFNGLDGFPSAKTEYGAGFKNGCQIGWNSVGMGLMTEFMPKLDPELLVKSTDYRIGWWDGYEQCVYTYDHDVI